MSNATKLKDPIFMAAIVSAVEAYIDTEAEGASRYPDAKRKWRHAITNDFAHVNRWKQILYRHMNSY